MTPFDKAWDDYMAAVEARDAAIVTARRNIERQFEAIVEMRRSVYEAERLRTGKHHGTDLG